MKGFCGLSLIITLSVINPANAGLIGFHGVDKDAVAESAAAVQARGGVTWQNVPGSLKQVSADATHVWGVNADDAIYRRPVDGSGAWQQVAGSLKQVSASGKGWIWGVNRHDDIYRCAKPCPANGSGWVHVPGKLKQVSADETYVWGTNSGNAIYRRPVDGSGAWQGVAGSLKDVTVSGRSWVWGVNRYDDIYRCAKPCPANGSGWIHVPGKLKQISANETHVWGTNAGDAIYRTSVNGSGSWEQVPGLLENVTASGQGWIWGASASGAIFKLGQTSEIGEAVQTDETAIAAEATETERLNRQVEEENRMIEAMREEARKLEQELKALESGGGGG